MEEKVENKSVIGEKFEDMTLAEMVKIQGSGDVEAEISPTVFVASALVSGGFASASAGIAISKFIRG